MSILKNFIDPSVRPQDDFFHFACGTWIKKNPIPKAESTWGSFYVLRDRGIKKVNAIFKELDAKERLPAGSEALLIRNVYRSGIDMKKRNARGLEPVLPTLRAISRITNHDELFEYLFSAHRNGNTHWFNYAVRQDDKNTDRYIFNLWQGGLSLPDRDYYLKTDARSVSIQNAFTAYVSETLARAGYSRKDAERYAADVYAFEKKLARASMSQTDRRDIEKVYHKLTVSQLQKLAPDFPWKSYFKTLGVSVTTLLVDQPAFLSSVSSLLQKTPLPILKASLHFDVLDGASSFLTTRDVRRTFNFHGRVLQGKQALKPNWKRVAQVVDAYLGEPVGKEYVKRYFPESSKRAIEAMVKDLIAAYETRIRGNEWMTAATKKRALEKLSRVRYKLGYPTHWRSYKGLSLSPDTYYENIEAITRFGYKKMRGKLGKKVDRREWHTSPQTVNAFYDPNNNEILFPAGILQPPFFDPTGDPAVNYGAMGSVIGHELTHGFDDSGAKFDGKGNYKNWWSARDKKEFEKRAAVLVKQFNTYQVADLPVNGKLTLGENIADLGGLLIAYDAFRIFLEKHPKHRALLGGFTPEQRFFLGLGFFEASHRRPEYARMLVMVDPHAPPHTRVNGPVSNCEAFYHAFQVEPRDALYRSPKTRAAIW